MATTQLYPRSYRDSKPVKKILGQNLEFSGFIPLIRKVHYEMAIEDRLPFCIFQHAMTEFLVAYQLHHAKYVLNFPELQGLRNPLDAINAEKYYIPQAIYEYICKFGPTTAPYGDFKVCWSLPNIAIPKGPIILNQVRIRSGTFGPITASNHNVYECYVSPYVTSEYIRECAKIKETVFTYDWNPLHCTWCPENSTPNENFLGYRSIECLSPDSMKVCGQCEFADNESVEGLLCHSDLVMNLSSSATKESETICGVLAEFKPMENNTAFIIKERIDKQDVAAILWDEPGKLKSPFPFSASGANEADIFTYKRKRNSFAPGTCYLSNGEPPQGWLETINSNFTCSGPFAMKRKFQDRESLRSEDHED